MPDIKKYGFQNNDPAPQPASPLSAETPVRLETSQCFENV